MNLRHAAAATGLALSILAATTTGTLAQGRRFDPPARGFKSEAAAEACQPGLDEAVRGNTTYRRLYSILLTNEDALQLLLEGVTDQGSYASLLEQAGIVAAAIDGGRVLITLPDGTVVVDTSALDDAENALLAGNSYEHFVSKTVNENHNSRVAVLSAQLYPCGIGVESKLSTSTGDTESYVALRLGQHLNSLGTVRLSTAVSVGQSRRW